MPRINIEDSLYKDNRFIELCIKCGGRSKALGELVSMWLVAQKYYLSHHEVPNEVWVTQNLCEDIVSCGLAERTSTGVRARGQDEQFAWLRAKQNAGKKSAKKRKETNGSAQPLSRTAVRNSSNSARTAPNGPEPLSLSLPPSLPLSHSRSSKKEESNAAHSSATPAGDTHEKIAYFAERWKLKYKANYSIIPKEAGVVKNAFKGMGLEKFKDLVDAYLQMHEGQFLAKRHDITSLSMNVPKVSHFAQTGVKVTRHDVNQIELREHNSNVFTALAKERNGEN